MKASHYFDHASTTRVYADVFEAMKPWYTELWGNAHSIHSLGLRAYEAVEKARAQVATLIGAEDPEQIIFTSGSTEACNVVLKTFACTMHVSPFEHSAIRVPACRMGCPVIPNKGWELFPDPKAKALAIMKVNNETGAVLNPRMLPDAYIMSDITQAVGKIPVDPSEFDAAALSAHKFHGPQGVGALYLKDPDCLGCDHALIEGGTHEHGMRGGTLNVPGIVGMGEAARIMNDSLDERLAHSQELRDHFIGVLEESGLGNYRINENKTPAEPFSQMPNVLSLTIFDLVAQTMLVELDAKGFGVSAGPACSSRNPNPSPVLAAAGLPPLEAQATLRISFGEDNTKETTEELARLIAGLADELRL